MIKILIQKIRLLKEVNLFRPKIPIDFILSTSVPKNWIKEGAIRRKNDLENNGFKNIDFENLKNQIKKRDFDDSNREISPLVKARDALEIITDGYSISEIVEKILEIYKEKIPKELQWIIIWYFLKTH